LQLQKLQLPPEPLLKTRRHEHARLKPKPQHWQTRGPMKQMIRRQLKSVPSMLLKLQNGLAHKLKQTRTVPE
jgi:hypothetical protein